MILIWLYVRLAKHRNVLQRDTYYFYTWSTIQSMYFLTLTVVTKMSQYFYFFFKIFSGIDTFIKQ